MFDAKRRNQLGVRIMLGFIVGILGAGMLIYLIPQGTADTPTADIVATVGNDQVTVNDVRTQLTRIQASGAIPPALQSLYAQQVLNQLVFAKELEIEAQRLGIEVTDQERAARIRELVPTAFVGDTFVGLDQYAAQIQQRAGMTVPEFEDLITQGMIEEKFRQLVTGGVTVSPAEIQEEFRRQNEKVKLDYVIIKPDDLEAKIMPSEADLTAYFEKNRARYAIPERRTVRYAMLGVDQLRLRTAVSDDEIRTYYNDHLDMYKLPDRAHVAHILFKTVGKTDAEAEEIRKKAEDVQKQAKSGKDFGALAKQYSEDTSKDKGGDIDWIVRGQTVPEFEAVAFSLPKGSISDVVKTQYGFHIIKVIDRENARTQTVDEVRPMILATLQAEKAEQAGQQISDQIASDIRTSGRVPLEDLAKKYGMTIGESQPLDAGATIPEIGNSPEIADDIFRLRQGDDSPPIQTDKGYVVLTLKDVQAAHPGTLAEVHDKVLADYRREKAVELAKSQAQDLARRAKSGEDLDKTAKSLGLDAKTSDLLARVATNVPDIGAMTQLTSAFTLPNGQTADPVFLGANWAVYRVVDHQQPNPADLTGKTKDDIEQKLLDGKREMAFEAFRTALDARMKQSGDLKINADNLKLAENANQQP